MQTISVVIREDERNLLAKQVYSYFSSIIPRVGETLIIQRHPPYQVTKVIHIISNGNASVTLEVKEVI